MRRNSAAVSQTKAVARICKEEGKQGRLVVAQGAGGLPGPGARLYCQFESHQLLKGAKGKRVRRGTTGGNEEKAAELHVKPENEIQEGTTTDTSQLLHNF